MKYLLRHFFYLLLFGSSFEHSLSAMPLATGYGQPEASVIDASQVAVSVSVACASAIVPIIPSSKNKLIIAVVAGLGDGSSAMAKNICKQYNELKRKYRKASFGELLGRIYSITEIFKTNQ